MLSYKEYEIGLDLMDVESALESLASDYNTGYVNDIMHEVADSFTPIYYFDIWDDAYEISEYVQKGIDEMLCDTSDINKILQTGWYLFIYETLLENIETVLYNHAIKYIVDMDDEKLNGIDENELAERIEFIDVCNFDTFEELESEIDDIIDELKEE